MLFRSPWRKDRLPTPVFSGFPGGSAGKESTCYVGNLGLIPGLGRSPGEGSLELSPSVESCGEAGKEDQSTELLFTPTLCDPMDYTVHGILQARMIFPTQGSNPGLPHCRWSLYQLSHQGGPRILEWVAYSFSRESYRPRTPALQVNSLPSEPPGRPKNTGVGSLSHLRLLLI